jgi:uncharacterized protein DUF6491
MIDRSATVWPRAMGKAFTTAAFLSALAMLSFSSMLRADDATAADNTTATDNAERCITLRSIKQTKILDDQNILFYTSGNRNYKNHLPYPCGGLAVADTFMYRTSESKLCNVDIITVLNKLSSSFMPGPSCGLGMFEPVDQQQLDELTKKPVKKP